MLQNGGVLVRKDSVHIHDNGCGVRPGISSGDVRRQLASRLNELDARVDAEAIVAFRNLVDSVVVHDRHGGVEVEVIGHLPALIGANAEMLGGRVVAEEGFEPPTQGL